MFPLPYKNGLKNRTRQNVGGISIWFSIQNVPESPAHILPREILRIGLLHPPIGDRLVGTDANNLSNIQEFLLFYWQTEWPIGHHLTLLVGE
jgi:hypothetical protein